MGVNRNIPKEYRNYAVYVFYPEKIVLRKKNIIEFTDNGFSYGPKLTKIKIPKVCNVSAVIHSVYGDFIPLN
ncbi:MAG: hypothetical protein PVH88_01885 [Ignavibacteria bacterium]|jgi:hypothetical protein